MTNQSAEKIRETRTALQGAKKELQALSQDSLIDQATRNELDRAYNRLAEAEGILERTLGEAAKSQRA